MAEGASPENLPKSVTEGPQDPSRRRLLKNLFGLGVFGAIAAIGAKRGWDKGQEAKEKIEESTPPTEQTPITTPPQNNTGK